MSFCALTGFHPKYAIALLNRSLEHVSRTRRRRRRASTYSEDTIKVKKALDAKGPAYIGILASCHRGWRIKPEDSIANLRIATDTCFWPLYEVENGTYKVNYKPKQKLPVVEWLRTQGRFSHLFREENKPIIEEFQREVDKKWESLLARSS